MSCNQWASLSIWGFGTIIDPELFFSSSSSFQVHLADQQSYVKSISSHSSSMTLTGSESEDIQLSNIKEPAPDKMEFKDCPASSSKTFKR